MSMISRKKSRLGYDNLPREYRDIPRAGTQPRDRYDEMFKARATEDRPYSEATPRASIEFLRDEFREKEVNIS